MARKQPRNDDELRQAWGQAKAIALFGAAKSLFPENPDSGRKALEVIQALKDQGLHVTYSYSDKRLGTMVA